MWAHPKIFEGIKQVENLVKKAMCLEHAARGSGGSKYDNGF